MVPGWGVTVRYVVVGGGATALHISASWLLLSRFDWHAQLVNGVAFLIAFGWSFAGNYLWTFGASGIFLKTLVRFFAVSVCGYVASSFVLDLLSGQLGFGFREALLCSSLVVPPVTFISSWAWAFKAARRR